MTVLSVVENRPTATRFADVKILSNIEISELYLKVYIKEYDVIRYTL